ncbi:MAG: alpha/beta hydrolase, partial [Eudoraea sp.]
MPLIESNYNPPLPFKSGHISTIYSGLIRKVSNFSQQRERLELKDGDFIDLDWSFSATPSNVVVILLHGLEGHGQRPY